MKKTKVVIASILKPIDDTRMYEKFGLSLEQTNKYEINIIGFASKNIPANNQINFHPLKPFNRLSINRLLSRLKVWQIYIKVKPEIIIANTHELLIVTMLYRILFGAKIVYDIRENYAKNIRYQKIYPWPIKPFMSLGLRMKEWFTAPFFHAHILAEGSYQKELPFLKSKTIVLENKYKVIEQLPQKQSRTSDYVRLLYSGTIAESYGIFDAIELVKKLHTFKPNIRLTIIGFCAKRGELLRLKSEIEDSDFIDLHGGDHLVPHQEIVSMIKISDFGLIFNKPNKISDQKLPTRLFEYTANHLPVLCINNKFWITFLQQFNAGLSINLKHYKPESLLVEMANGIFYNQGNTSTSLWESEETKLVELINSL